MKSFRNLLLPVLLLGAGAARSDFESAANAYRNKDYPSAYAQFLDLAEAGDPRAQTVIALMHKYGESVEPDLSVSFSWYLKAAEIGYAPAQFNVGEMYAEGIGVAADREAAVTWLTRAARSGFERANDRLAALNAGPVTGAAKVDSSIPWSKQWNFRLPNEMRFTSETAPVPGTSYRVQLGAMKTQAAANRLWDLVVRNNQALFRNYEPLIVLAGDETDRIYRVQTGPFDDFKQARDFCETLTQQDSRADCLPMRQR